MVASAEQHCVRPVVHDPAKDRMVAANDRRVGRNRFEHCKREALLKLPAAGNDQQISRLETLEHVGVGNGSEKLDLLFNSELPGQTSHRLDFASAGKNEPDLSPQSQVGNAS